MVKDYYCHSPRPPTRKLVATTRGGAGNYKCTDKERRALLHLKSYIHEDPFGLLATWTNEEEATDDCCEWSGVTCNNKTGHVTTLNLALGGFEGKVSHSLLNLSYLNHLDLSYNYFDGTIPMFIGSMNQLRHLDLSYNSFTGTIPKFIGFLTELRYLGLSGNIGLNGPIPLEIGNLKNLRNLLLRSLRGCRVEDIDWLHNMSWLEELTMDGISLAKANKWVNVILTLKKLSSLSLGGCNLSHVMHPYSYSFVNSSSSSINSLYLGDNNLNSSMYHWLLSLTSNRLVVLDLSYNMLDDIGKYIGNMSRLSNVEEISLRSCNLGPRFPKWFRAMKNLTRLDISNTSISDTIDVEFWNMWPSQLTYLDLSSNNITGKVTDLLSNFDSEFTKIDLSSNNFHGSILNISSTVALLDLSKNKFYGEISFLCQIVDGFLYFLDLSHNSFTGRIPDCLWHLQSLQVLNLGQNNFFGRLPASIEYLISLEVLYLYNNSFSGEFPLSLMNCTKLNFLELGDNKFYGSVPVWITEKLPRLYALSLTSNNFFGTIPTQLCQLVNLQILDLSANNLYGTIPSCLSNLSAMFLDGFSPYIHFHDYYFLGRGEFYAGHSYANHALIKWQGSVREFKSNLVFLKTIDLSSNNLTGQIPNELTNLYGLISLNLSNNSIFGEIPQNIGKMKQLLTLDLSRNNISGVLPSSMSHMTSLNYLDVSYNNLSGRIPSSTQLQSFQPSRYTGNKGLCGPPVTKYCPGDKELKVTPVGQSEVRGEGMDELKRWFYIGGASGFAAGFWIVCGALLLTLRGRRALFRFVDSFEDWVYVKVMVIIAKWQRSRDA